MTAGRSNGRSGGRPTLEEVAARAGVGMCMLVHHTFIVPGMQTMFLSSIYDSNAFSFCLGGTVIARCAAIEAELCYLPNFSGREIVVQSEGRCVLITGYVTTEIDFYRALNIANDIAGSDRVIFRVSLDQSTRA